MTKKLIKDKPKEKKDHKKLVISIIFAFLMITSIIGFSMSGNSLAKNKSGTNISLQENVFQNPQTGELYWGAIIGKEQFIFFENVENYLNDDEMYLKAQKLKNSSLINIYIQDEADYNFIFELERTFNALNILNQRSTENICDSNTIVFIDNSSNIEGDCIVFENNGDEIYSKVQSLLFNLLRE